MATSPQTLTVDQRRLVAAWAADCAEHVLAVFERTAPDDTRVRDAIAQARDFAAGDLAVADAIRRRGGEAGAAARDAPTAAARAAAYAAEQAAACAHMGAHALGAAGYAGKAATLDAGCTTGEVTRVEATRMVAAMSDGVAAAITSLPLLGESSSGPLTAGRLATGHVGETILAIQALMRTRAGE